MTSTNVDKDNDQDIKRYFEKVSKDLDELTNEEFEQLLIQSGIKKCPFEECTKIEF